ncbi:MAG: hypothetical protein V2A70_07780, partial [Candidatus Omnitrophota bacterium]
MEDKKLKDQETKNVASNAANNSGARDKDGKPQGMESVDKAEKKLAYSSDNDPNASRGQGAQGGRGGDRGRGRKPRGPRPEAESSGLIESVIRIARVAKVTKGGTKMSFSALVVVGDGNGHVGYA